MGSTRTLCIPDHTGHSEISWDPGNEAETEVARASFEAAKKKGMKAYRIDKRGERGSELTEFDPEAREIVMVAPLVGG